MMPLTLSETPCGRSVPLWLMYTHNTHVERRGGYAHAQHCSNSPLAQA
jgi:hypothetical protein